MLPWLQSTVSMQKYTLTIFGSSSSLPTTCHLSIYIPLSLLLCGPKRFDWFRSPWPKSQAFFRFSHAVMGNKTLIFFPGEQVVSTRHKILLCYVTCMLPVWFVCLCKTTALTSSRTLKLHLNPSTVTCSSTLQQQYRNRGFELFRGFIHSPRRPFWTKHSTTLK